MFYKLYVFFVYSFFSFFSLLLTLSDLTQEDSLNYTSYILISKNLGSIILYNSYYVDIRYFIT